MQRKLCNKLARFGSFIERVSVRVKDVNGPRGGVDQLCRIKVVMRGQPSVIFESRDSSLNAAVDVALAGVQRAVRRKTARRRIESAEIELVVRGILPSGTVLYRRRSEMREYPIIVTDQDLRRLRGLLGGIARHRSWTEAI